MKIIEASGIFTYNVTAISYLATFYLKQSRIKTTVEGRLLRKTTSHICFKNHHRTPDLHNLFIC